MHPPLRDRLQRFVAVAILATPFSLACFAANLTIEQTIPGSVIQLPSTPLELLHNLNEIVSHDLAFVVSDFYSDQSLQRLLGASQITGERTSEGVALQLQPLRSVPGATCLVMHEFGTQGKRTTASIKLELNEPSVRPAYMVVARIFGTGWTPLTSPGQQTLQNPYGNMQLRKDVKTAVATTTITTDFDADGKLSDIAIVSKSIASGTG